MAYLRHTVWVWIYLIPEQKLYPNKHHCRPSYNFLRRSQWTVISDTFKDRIFERRLQKYPLDCISPDLMGCSTYMFIFLWRDTSMSHGCHKEIIGIIGQHQIVARALQEMLKARYVFDVSWRSHIDVNKTKMKKVIPRLLASSVNAMSKWRWKR